MIRSLRLRTDRETASARHERPCCSRYIQHEGAGRVDCASETSDHTKSAPLRRRPRSDTGERTVGCSKCMQLAEGRERDEERTSGSEITSRSSPPKPPRRLFRKKKPLLDDSRWRWRDASVQRPERCDAAMDAAKSSFCSRCAPADSAVCVCSSLFHYLSEIYERESIPTLTGDEQTRCCQIKRAQREFCDAEHLLERVSGTRDALHSSHRRWSHRAPSRSHTHTHTHATDAPSVRADWASHGD
ncbi:unnamed protein product, partial [Iphiclides podalirius]